MLTREGWLQPWVRLRKTEDEERQAAGRDVAVPDAQPSSARIKPGAVVLSEVHDRRVPSAPALVAQSFGKGHVAALLIGDLWRWGMRRENQAEATSIARGVRPSAGWSATCPAGSRSPCVPRPTRRLPALSLVARVRDAEYRPLDNAKVAFESTCPAART